MNAEYLGLDPSFGALTVKLVKLRVKFRVATLDWLLSVAEIEAVEFMM